MWRYHHRRSMHSSIPWYLLALFFIGTLAPLVNVLPAEGPRQKTKRDKASKGILAEWNEDSSRMINNNAPWESPNRPRRKYPVNDWNLSELHSYSSSGSSPEESSSSATSKSTLALFSTTNTTSTTTSSSSSAAISTSGSSSITTPTMIPLLDSMSTQVSQISAEIKSTFVTQEALQVQDNSFSALPDIQKLLTNDDFHEVLDRKFVGTSGDVKSMSSFLKGTMAEQNFEGETYVEAVSPKHGKPFLFTGSMKSRTKKNCYVIKTKENLDEGARNKIRQILETLGGRIRHDYGAKGLSGFSVCFPEKELPISLLKSITSLVWIERDQYSSVRYTQPNAPWQLPRMNNPKSPLVDSTYHFNATGKGVNVYAIDSGVMMDHPEFGGRAKIGFTVFDSGGFPNDCAGHGTQVASVIAGTNVGVAKMANIISCQVLDCDGQGENSSVLAALNWIAVNHAKPAVVNMSVGGPKSPTVDAAVQAVVAQGVGVIVAAGNSMIDACNLSPSGVESAMVVGASTSDLERADFSNYGSCVDLFAPGRHVIAAALPSQATKNGFTFVSGTSLSAPLVTGIYALFLEQNPALTPAELKRMVLEASASDFMSEKTLLGSPNLLAQIPSLPQNTNFNIAYLPFGTLPVLGSPTAGPGTTEIVLICLSGVLVAISIIAVIGVCIMRRKRSKEEEQDAKFDSAFL